MNYPVWDLTTIGGGSWIALIAILHVLISHFAVGGGFFLWYFDRKAAKTHDAQLLEFVRRHVWFFLLLTIVGGGMTGVGIWFIIALVNPAATSALIHSFVFAWAIEWVFFLVEISALLIYHYRFDMLTERDRGRIAFCYFLFAWLSLAAINGILSFMLTPGRWIATHNIWDGLLNPSYLPSLVFRTAMALILAGVFGYLTAVRTREDAFRQRLVVSCSRWILLPAVVLVLAAVWYLFSLPDEVRRTTFVLNPQHIPFTILFLGTTAVLFIAGAVLMRKWPRPMQGFTTALLVLIALAWIGSFEYLREISRKPYIISDYMYDSSIRVEQVPLLNKDGVLPHASWSSVRSVTNTNLAEAGREVFRLECQCCHTIGGIRNDIRMRTRDFTHLGILASLTGQGKFLNYMPPFIGTREEKEALAYYLTTTVNGKPIEEESPAQIHPLRDETIPAFDMQKSDYVLLAWNDLGMHCISDGDAWFSFLPPANTIQAQLIKRGNPPQIITSGVVLSYAVEAGFENPANHSEFWHHSESLFGVALQKNVGLFGKGTHGVLDPDSGGASYIARGIPLVPYSDDGTYNPYPCITVEARDSTTGALVMSTKLVAPVSAEIGCRNCHGGGWRYRSAGLSAETAQDILARHDRINGTDLLARARGGEPQLCQSCHPDPVLNAPGKPGVLDFSAAMHAWHALYLPFNDARACALCHPSAVDGTTQCLRDLHAALGQTCIDCHGNVVQDALALLKGDGGKIPAHRLMAFLKDAPYPIGNARVPWVQENDCLTCHEDFQPSHDTASAFGKWTSGLQDLYRSRSDMAGIRCPACHGSTHALYPSHNIYNRDRDNIQPLQYTGSRIALGGNKSCPVCHRQAMQNAIHHPNMELPFRNTKLLE